MEEEEAESRGSSSPESCCGTCCPEDVARAVASAFSSPRQQDEDQRAQQPPRASSAASASAPLLDTGAVSGHWTIDSFEQFPMKDRLAQLARQPPQLGTSPLVFEQPGALRAGGLRLPWDLTEQRGELELCEADNVMATESPAGNRMSVEAAASPLDSEGYRLPSSAGSCGPPRKTPSRRFC